MVALSSNPIGAENMKVGDLVKYKSPNNRWDHYWDDVGVIIRCIDGTDKIIIATNDEGLRLITIVDQNKDLIEVFNRGLNECKKRGIYQNLLMKWELN